MKRAIVLLIALATWLYPIKVASAEFISDSQPIQVVKEEVKVPSNEPHIEAPQPIQTRNSETRQRADNSRKWTPTTADSGRDYLGKIFSKEEVIQLIVSYSEQYGINAEVPLCIAKHESGFNQFAKNPTSSASGVFQYLRGTFAGTDEGKSGLSIWDADANIRAAIKYMASRHSTQPWEVRNRCPKL